MLVAQLSDIHYCERYMEEADRCMAFAIERLRETKPELIILSGDLFDHRLEQNSRALLAAVCRVSELGCIAPVLILQGTLSHDALGALNIFRHVMSDYPIYVVDRIQQVFWQGYFDRSDSWAFSALPDTETPFSQRAAVLISCLPSINKGAVAAAVGTEDVAQATGEQAFNLLKAWAPLHLAARAAGIPTIVVSHGTVSECVTEHGVPMAGLDWEFTTGSLFAAEASAVLLGHIHKHQSWDRDGRKIAYPGSIGRLHFGEVDPKGFLVWDVQPASASFQFIETPAKRLLEVTFPGTPDLVELAKLAKDAAGAHVRIRWTVDEEHRDAVDREAITAMFGHAEAIKLEGTIAPVQRQRAAGIGQAVSLADKVTRWGEVTQTDTAPLQERLTRIQVEAPEKIVEELV